MEEFNIGTQIKEVVESKGMSVTEFAKRINKSRENCYSIFARKTIDTGLLQIISDVLDHDFFLQFSSSYQQMSEETQKLRDENTLLKEYYSLLKGKDNS
ncbi:MAG: helix-turn-helix domain-containing protein [Flavobacteriales bacterium]